MINENNQVPSNSLDITEQNIEKMKELFPEVLTEKKIDFDKLRLILGDEVETAQERYNFTWNGKKQAMQLAQQPTVATLKTNKTKSKNWDKTRNLYIEGDNLEVLKILQKSYANKVKLIYLDPPYNTGSDFVYQDRFQDSLENYLEVTGQVDDTGKKLTTNSEMNGRYHTEWLNMMYPRLMLARNLLTSDGVIFISIDDNEQGNLRKICDEIFGEKNLITQIVHKSRASVSNDKIISQNHNFILLYAKNIDVVFSKRSKVGLDPALEGFSNPDDDARGDWKGTPVDGPGGAKKGNPYYEFMGVEGYFRYSKETMQQMYDEGLIIKTKNGLQRKYFLSDAKKTRKTDTSWWDDGGYTSNATRKLITLMGEKTFDTPKPVELIERMLKLFTNDDKEAIILDFFSGSATTAEAVMKINVEDEGTRSYILAQLPEVISEKTDAYIAGYRKIPEIAEERIRRAGDKIIADNPSTAGKLDIGFKVFELEKSNLKKWNAEPEDLVTMFDSIQDNLEPGSTEDDLVYEIMLKQGLELTLPIEKIVVGEANVYKTAFGSLFIILGKNITSEAAKKIVELINDEELENVGVVLQDTGFATDSDKLNSIEILNAGGVNYNEILSI